MMKNRKKHVSVDSSGIKHEVSWVESAETLKRAAASPWLISDPWIAHGIHGFSRIWHKDGGISLSTAFREGLPFGATSWWDSKGVLRAFSVAVRGVEHTRNYSSSSALLGSVITVKDGAWGVHRVWGEAGELLTRAFQVRSTNVSERKFHAQFLSAAMPAHHRAAILESLKPEYDVFNLERWMSIDLITQLLLGAKEARSWMAASADRGVGEGRSKLDSAELIQQIYRLGATKVWVAEIKDEGDGAESSSILIIELPAGKAERAALLSWSNAIAESSGFDIEEDLGQAVIMTVMD